MTFGGSNPGKYVQAVTPDPTSITVHLHHSFIALPDDGYEPRAYHPYSGYWKTSFFDYATGISEPLEQRYITRHRLAKKDVGAKQSEPVEPIVYYLDPGIPEPVMSALKDGASWWNQAFEAAGYTNAFQVKVLPADADPMDVRYNVIQWVHRATRGWSYGSSVVDPRTGEIIKGHVTLGSLRVRQDYLIALGLTSPFADTKQTDEQQQMALDRIRQLSAHEVGHTLGVAHNFAASEDGRESVMDYPHPQITLNNGEISLANAYDKGMGQWDLHAIAYGYQDYPEEAQEQAGLARQIKQSREAGLSFKTDFDTRSSASASANGHLWENGADPLQELNKMVRIRELALQNMGLATLPDNRSLSALEDALVPVYLLHRFAVVAAAKQVGGLVYEYEQKGDYAKPKGQQPVAAAIQKQAIKAVLDTTTAEFLRLPESLIKLIPPTAYGDDITREHFNGRMGLPLDPVSAAASAANYSLGLLLTPQRLNRLAWQASQARGLPGVHALTLRIFEQHWYNNKSADYGLQKRLRMVALNAVMQAVQNPELAPEVRLEMQSVLYKFTDWLKQDSGLMEAGVLHQQMTHYWQTGQWQAGFEVPALPPGSPI
nr:zinc-dependent metalloprotease [Salinimonas marina]